MALIKCSECGTDVSTTAKTCPKCGAKVVVPKKQWKDLSLFQKLAGLALVGVVGYFAFNAGTGIKEKTDIEHYGKPAEKHEWTYSTGAPDKMTGGVTTSATLISESVLQFGFPYKDSVPSLTVMRTTDKKGTRENVLLEVSKGQFLCFQACSISVKFDNGAIQKFSAWKPSDGTTTILYLRDVKPFVEQLKKSKRVLIEADFYKNAGTQMEFTSADLKW